MNSSNGLVTFYKPSSEYPIKVMGLKRYNIIDSIGVEAMQYLII